MSTIFSCMLIIMKIPFCKKSVRLIPHEADVYSYNWTAPPKRPELLLVEVDCHWLVGTSLLCCVIQVTSALWLLPPGPPPPEPLSRKNFTAPLLTNDSSWLVVRMGALPEQPPSVITGSLVARMMESASIELVTATRYVAVPWLACR